MNSLRRQLLIAIGLLIGLQVANAVLALGSWQLVLQAVAREQMIAEWRAEVDALGAAVREQYVHQAHTFIEGGLGHIEHQAAVESNTRLRLEHLEQLPLPERERKIIQEMKQEQKLLSAYFSEKVIPAVQSKDFDRAHAIELHRISESQTSRLSAQADELSRQFDQWQATERTRAEQSTSRVWTATIAFTGLSVLLAGLVASRLARSVLAPVEAIRTAAAQWGDVHPETADLGEIAHAFKVISLRLSQAEQRRAHQQRLAALGEMSAAVAHELMNPLTVIIGHAQLSSDPAWLPVREEAEYARKVVDGLLGFARPGRDEPQQVDVEVEVNKAVERLIPMADAKDIDIIVEGHEVQRFISPSTIRWIMDNLLRNAIEASPNQGKIRITVLSTEIRVTDQGNGISSDILLKLYEPFVTGKAQGTGLGLAIAERAARASGGQLSHRNLPQQGTEAIWKFEQENP